MIEDIQTLIAAIESGYLKDKRWVIWSERRLLESENVPTWLVGLYDAETAEAALVELYAGLHKLMQTAESIDRTGLLLGFIYLRYIAGEMSLSEFLHEAGSLSDARNYSDPDCEAIYALLNDYEEHESSSSDLVTSTSEVDKLFLRHADFARQFFENL